MNDNKPYLLIAALGILLLVNFASDHLQSHTNDLLSNAMLVICESIQVMSKAISELSEEPEE